MEFLGYIVVGPLLIGGLFGLVYMEVGVTSLAGLVVAILLTPLQMYLGRKVGTLR